MKDFTATHFAHCNQGENEGVCCYGDQDCPALQCQIRSIWRVYEHSARAERPWAWLTVDQMGDLWEATINARYDMMDRQKGIPTMDDAMVWCERRYRVLLQEELKALT